MKPGSRLFGDARTHVLDAEVRARCTNRGIVNESAIQAAQAAERAKFAGLLAENDEASLPIEQFKAILAAQGRGALTPAEVVALKQSVAASERQPLQPLGESRAVLAAEQASNATRPALKALLDSGVGNDRHLVHLRLQARREELAAPRPTAGKRGTFG